MSLEFLNPSGLCPTFGWTHVVATSGGKTIHISGQVGIDAKGELVGRGDLKRGHTELGAYPYDQILTRLKTELDTLIASKS